MWRQRATSAGIPQSRVGLHFILSRAGCFPVEIGHYGRGSKLIRKAVPFAMPVARQPVLDSDLRSALHQLDSSVDGYPEALFLAHGFRPNLVEALIKDGYISVATTHMRVGGRIIAVRRMRITEVGRRALAG